MKKVKQDAFFCHNEQSRIDQILKEFEKCCDEAIIRREGKRLILEPKKRQISVSSTIKYWNNDFPHVDITLFGDFRG